jgi:hypothetical protein
LELLENTIPEDGPMLISKDWLFDCAEAEKLLNVREYLLERGRGRHVMLPTPMSASPEIEQGSFQRIDTEARRGESSKGVQKRATLVDERGVSSPQNRVSSKQVDISMNSAVRTFLGISSTPS